mmetsp:Transcript_10576/g.33515  ORF Transcript_10576/g.33515 Transcript_10576/m.33515 type:complete len:87 (+) Transcript_10576:83-343(+)
MNTCSCMCSVPSRFVCSRNASLAIRPLDSLVALNAQLDTDQLAPPVGQSCLACPDKHGKDCRHDLQRRDRVALLRCIRRQTDSKKE